MNQPQFSKIISGCMSWGAWGKKLSTSEMAELMTYCVETGVTTFDHADIYGDYTTEAEFGTAFLNSGISRSNVQFITKCGIQYVGQSRTNQIKHYNYSKDYIIWSVDTSLKHLKTDYVDALLLHRPSALMRPDDIAEAVTQLKDQGKILSFGVSNFMPTHIEMISTMIEVDINQIEYSLTHYAPQNNGVLDQMISRNIKAMAWAPLGDLFKNESDQVDRINAVLESLCTKYEATSAQLLLAWLMKHPSGVHPVIGTTNFERIKNAVDATTLHLDLEDWFKLLVASQGHKVP